MNVLFLEQQTAFEFLNLNLKFEFERQLAIVHGENKH